MKKSLYIILSLILAFSLLITSCRSAPEVTPSTVTQGGVLNLYGIDPLTLDPGISGDATSHQYVLLLFSGLVRLNNNLEPVPDIAQQWQISDDGRTYTFHLRQDVRFHDGREVKAQDFEYSWQRACDPDTGSLTVASYLGDIVGVEQVIAGESKGISGVTVIDDYTLRVTINAPKSYFLSKLTYPTAFVLDKANIETGENWWHNPNGTGPFKLEEWEENTLLILKKNELYYGKTANINSVVFQLWGGVPMNMYETGKIDITSVYLHYIDKAADKAGSFYRELSVIPELSFFYIGFNTTKPPFNDVNIRRAFSQAVDKVKLASLVFKDMVQPADGILPPGIPGFNKDLIGLNYDPNRSKELIAASKYGDSSRLPPITITTSGEGGLISPELEAIVYEWRQNLGVEVKVRQLEPQRFIYHLMQEKDGMFYFGWIADYPHPQNFLEVLFRSGADNNAGEYSNPEIDALLEMANLELDSNLSLGIYQLAEQKLVDDVACLPLWFGKNYILVKTYVKDYNLNPLGLAMLNDVSIEPH
jgi:oligopeptide transport system substrate-binding protein